MKVIKFGGTSMASASQIIKVGGIVLSDPERRIVVVSAPGKRFSDDIKVTDLLITLAERMLESGNAEKELMAVVDRYNEIADELNIGSAIKNEIEKDLRTRVLSPRENEEKYLDCLKAAGEDNAARLFAAYLKSISVDAKYVNPKEAGLFLKEEFGDARMLPESYKNLSALRNEKSIVVFPGFFGYSKSGDVVTFSRGGSDITGAILAAAVNADVYENFTDVDSVYAANPKVIKDPKPIPCFTYEEMRELSYAGFNVLHEECMEPVYRKGVPINIRNTNNPEAPGTMIVKTREKDGHAVVGIACDTGFITIFVSKYMMNREIGFGRKLLQILQEEGVSYDHSPSGIDNMSIVIREKQVEGKLDHIIERIQRELDVDSVHVERDKALVMIVGEGMIFSLGVTGRAAMALAKNNINIEMINQGSSEVSLMFGIHADHADAAIHALYDEFFDEK